VIWDRPRYEFGDYNDFCPCGYGSRLGQALDGNEFVQTIELDLDAMLKNPIMDRINAGEADGLLNFLRSSSSLRTVKLRTTRERNGIEDEDGETLLEMLVFTAVAENPHGPIALRLDTMETEYGSYPVDVPPEALASALRATKSIEELVIWLGDGGSPGYRFGEDYQDDVDDEDDLPTQKEKAAGRALINKAFCDNSSRKRLHVLWESCEQSVAALVGALHQNGSLISVTCMDFTKIQRRRAEIYCTRNRRIGDVLTELSQLETEATNRSKVDWLPVRPTIFAVMKHSPKSATCRIFQCLIGLAKELGSPSRSSTKRTGIHR
jgi:hypothetical protein